MPELGECASSLEQFDRLARDVSAVIDATRGGKSCRASFEGHGAENPVPETFPAPSMDPARYDALTRQIETSHRQLAARLEAGLAAGANEMNTLRDLVGDAAKKMDASPRSRSRPVRGRDSGTGDRQARRASRSCRRRPCFADFA